MAASARTLRQACKRPHMLVYDYKHLMGALPKHVHTATRNLRPSTQSFNGTDW